MDELTKQRLDAQDKVLDAQTKLLEKMDKKLDAAVEAKTAVQYLRWAVGGAYAALTALGVHHLK